MKVSSDIYSKGSESILISEQNLFIYEVCVNVRFENRYCSFKRQLYTSKKELKYIKSHWVNPNVEIACSLQAAPKKWVFDNGFRLWVKPEKKTKIKKQKNA